MEYLVLYRWPGNVRQLANEMRRLAALAEIGRGADARTSVAGNRRVTPHDPGVRTGTRTDRGGCPSRSADASGSPHLEQTMMQYAIRSAEADIEETAAMLGLSRKGLYLKRQRFGIEPPQSHAPAATA